MTLEMPSKSKQPLNHVAIIMDGNGRWAKAKGLTRIKGHEEGVENAKRIVKIAQKYSIKYLTLYAFSSENWGRPKEEVDALLQLLEIFLVTYAQELIENKIKVSIIGQYRELPDKVVSAIDRLIHNTSHFTEYHLILAINYSSRIEIVETFKEILKSKNNIPIEKIDWHLIEEHLDTREIPDPDLIIRTSGEHRLSNFLLLQGAYSEIYFTETYWPDFNEQDFQKAIEYYKTRERRFGKTSDQLQNV